MNVELYLIRHAEAEDRAARGGDEARALTVKGRREFARVADALGARKVEFDQLLHSPLLRAVETANLLARLVRGETRVSLELARDPSPELLASCTGLRVALVGHEPWMSELCAWLVTGDRRLAGNFLFRKGGVARLDGDAKPGRMRVAWFAPPEFSQP